MKFFSFKKLRSTRVNSEDSLGLGMDVAVLLGIFLLIGFGLDRWLDTTPVFMIVMTIVGAVGIFAKFKYRYDAKMDQHEADRVGAASRRVAVDNERTG